MLVKFTGQEFFAYKIILNMCSCNHACNYPIIMRTGYPILRWLMPHLRGYAVVANVNYPVFMGREYLVLRETGVNTLRI